MVIVTGGFGFIGANIAKNLVEGSDLDVIIVDDIDEGRRFANLGAVAIADFYTVDQFNKLLLTNSLPTDVTAIIHMGACSDTTQWNGNFLMERNYNQTKVIYQYCLSNNVQLIYASSASVYGNGDKGFREDIDCEKPINMYAYSKWLFDQYFRRTYVHQASSPSVTGLRFFNVYGEREDFKERMASTPHLFTQQLIKTGVCNLFSGDAGVGDGEQRRDFVYVGDIVNLISWLLDREGVSGIFNVGSGVARSFNDVGDGLINSLGTGSINYIPFPKDLRGVYQSYTCADLKKLRDVGYEAEFSSLEDGIKKFHDASRELGLLS